MAMSQDGSTSSRGNLILKYFYDNPFQLNLFILFYIYLVTQLRCVQMKTLFEDKALNTSHRYIQKAS